MPKNFYLETGLIAVATVVAVTLATPALAQEAASAESSGFEDIIVTARKVQETQQSLPITIAAFSQSELQRKVVLNVADLQKVTPGLNVSVNTQGGAPIFAIRGTATANLIDGGVAVYFGDMPLQSTIGLVNSFYDVASVEILKGPQGTQFGTNTTGGTISVRPKPPSNDFEGYVQGGYGNYNRRELEGVLNVPINDVLKLRVAGNMVKRDGFVRNLDAVGILPRRLWNDNHYSARATLRAEKDSVTNDLIVDYYHEDDLPIPSVPVKLTDASFPGTNPSNFGAKIGTRDEIHLGPDPSGVNRTYFNRQELWGVQNVTNIIASDSLSLRNVIGYRHDHNSASESNSGINLALINVYSDTQNDLWVNDFTLRYNHGPLRANFGVYYSDLHKDFGVVANAAQNIFLVLARAPLVSNIHNRDRRTFQSKALYANLDYDITSTLTASGGIRYNWDKANLTYRTASGLGLPDVGYNVLPTLAVPCNTVALNAFTDRDLVNCIGRRNGSWKAASWNAVLTNKFSDRVLVYVKASHGYLAGGLNSSVREVPVFQPEKTTMFEGGLKADWNVAGRPVRTNIAVFYGTINNKQVVSNANYDDGASANGVFNAAKEQVYGADIELRISPVDGLDLNGSWSYLHAKWDEFQFPTVGGPVRTLQVGVDLSGQTPASVPKNQIALGASYTLPVDESVGTITASWNSYFTSKIRFRNTDLTRGLGSQWDTANSYWVSSASISWDKIAGSPVSARAWIKNVFDKNYSTYRDAQFQSFGYAIARFGEPRTYGLSVKVDF